MLPLLCNTATACLPRGSRTPTSRNTAFVLWQWPSMLASKPLRGSSDFIPSQSRHSLGCWRSCQALFCILAHVQDRFAHCSAPKHGTNTMTKTKVGLYTRFLYRYPSFRPPEEAAQPNFKAVLTPDILIISRQSKPIHSQP